jgi:replicative DNA helicase
VTLIAFPDRQPEWPVPEADAAEKSVLGAVLLRPDALQAAQDCLRSDLFRLVRHRVVWDAIVAVAAAGRAVDFVTVREELTNRGRLEDAGGLAGLGGLIDGVPKASNVAHYAGLVIEAARLRGLQEAAWLLCRQASTEAGTADELIAGAERKWRELSAGGGGHAQHDGDQIAALLYQQFSAAEAHDGLVTGLSTGFYDIDRMTGGLHAGELDILAGRPGHGKTSLAGAISWHVSNHGGVTFFASIEMSTKDIGLRLACLDAQVCFRKAREWRYVTPPERQRIMAALTKLEASGIVIDDSLRTVQDIRRGARLVQTRKGRLDLVVVDYLTMLRPSSLLGGRRGTDNRVREVGEMTGDLKALAKELKVPVLLLAQLNRSCESRPDKRPLLSDLRDSGEIEQDADLVGFVYLGHRYNDGPDNVGELIVAKHRNGSIGTIELKWTGEYMRYDNLDGSSRG